MKIAQVCSFTSPAKNSMGAERIVERITKGRVELGHEVVMKINPDSTNTPAPVVSEIPKDCDILHFHGWDARTSKAEYESYGIPYVVTMHGGGTEIDPVWLASMKRNPNMICVSKFISDRVMCSAFVHSCTHPTEVTYKADKDDYFLWMAGTDWGESKGLFSTITMAKRLRFKLILAGTGRNQNVINQIKSLEDENIKYVGALNGKEKATMLSNAKGFILMTKVPDACPATVSEALMSGTPIISSGAGCMPELVKPSIGFVCKNQAEFAQAISKIKKISPSNCRNYAMNNFSHLVASTKYLQYYNNMINYGNVEGDISD